MNQVMINTVALGWHEVDKSKAIRFVKLMLNQSAMSKRETVEYINKQKLKGTTVQKLLGG